MVPELLLHRATDLGEDDDLVHTVRASLCNCINHVLSKCQSEDAWHGGNWDILIAVLVHKEREDKVGWGDDALPDG